MKNKIKIFLIIIVLFTTGCTADFNVEIKDNLITENISVLMNSEELGNKTALDIIGNSVYEVEDDTQFLGYFSVVGSRYSNPLNATISYNINNYDFDYAISFCYDDQKITYNNNVLNIETSSYFTCFDKYKYVDKVNINVKTGYKVLESNADKVNGNTYTWNITKTNNKGLKLVLDTSHDELEAKEKESKKKTIILVSLIGGLLVVSLSVVLFLRYQKVNEF